MPTPQARLAQRLQAMAWCCAGGEDQRAGRTGMRHGPAERPKVAGKRCGRVVPWSAPGKATLRAFAGKGSAGGKRGVLLPTLHKIQDVVIGLIAAFCGPGRAPEPRQQMRARLLWQLRQNPRLTRCPQQSGGLVKHQGVTGPFGCNASPRKVLRCKGDPGAGGKRQEASRRHAGSKAWRIGQAQLYPPGWQPAQGPRKSCHKGAVHRAVGQRVAGHTRCFVPPCHHLWPLGDQGDKRQWSIRPQAALDPFAEMAGQKERSIRQAAPSVRQRSGLPKASAWPSLWPAIPVPSKARPHGQGKAKRQR